MVSETRKGLRGAKARRGSLMARYDCQNVHRWTGVYMRGRGTLALSDGNCKTDSDDAMLWARTASRRQGPYLHYVCTATIMPFGKISSTLAWRWAMPCSCT